MSEKRTGAVVIGGSAGAIDALSDILPSLSRDFALPIFVAVHIPTDKASLLADLLDKKCALKVLEAEDKMPIQPGGVYCAPPDYHLLIEGDQRIALSVDDPVNYSRPSIDVLFEAAADVYDGDLVGIVLTGANSDGAQGLKRICEQGGVGLVQRPEQAYAAAMPSAALATCPQAKAMSLEQIASFLRALNNPHPRQSSG